MKKYVFFILLLLVFMPIKKTIKPAFIDKIDLKLAKDELAIIFLTNNNNKALLLKHDTKAFLFLFKSADGASLKQDLKVFAVDKLDYLFTDIKDTSDLSYTLKKPLKGSYSEVFTKEKLNLTYQGKKFCIVEDKFNGECDYLYLLDTTKEVLPSINTKLVIYDKTLDNKIKESLYQKWLDKDVLDKMEYYVLKLDGEKFERILIPLELD